MVFIVAKTSFGYKPSPSNNKILRKQEIQIRILIKNIWKI